MIRVQEGDFDIGLEINRLTEGNTRIGGVSSFVGLVRDYTGNEKLTAMTLEHYPGMTEKQLATLETKARARWNLEDLLIVHRYGTLAPGDRIVLVITASSHRDDSLESCRFLIDWLKTNAPFWKLEDTASGSEWVSTRESDNSAVDRWVRDGVSK
ncbi:MAG: molybdenum cofactor biosynthesis protein MoaE [Pseudomonadota bacterium]|nr:molybdenum cofactor biosynthesis protein MoaE [Pseudomonadota bacterium]